MKKCSVATLIILLGLIWPDLGWSQHRALYDHKKMAHYSIINDQAVYSKAELSETAAYWQNRIVAGKALDEEWFDIDVDTWWLNPVTKDIYHFDLVNSHFCNYTRDDHTKPGVSFDYADKVSINAIWAADSMGFNELCLLILDYDKIVLLFHQTATPLVKIQPVFEALPVSTAASQGNNKIYRTDMNKSFGTHTYNHQAFKKVDTVEPIPPRTEWFKTPDQLTRLRGARTALDPRYKSLLDQETYWGCPLTSTIIHFDLANNHWCYYHGQPENPNTPELKRIPFDDMTIDETYANGIMTRDGLRKNTAIFTFVDPNKMFVTTSTNIFFVRVIPRFEE